MGPITHRLNYRFDAKALETDLEVLPRMLSVQAGFPSESHKAWSSVTLYEARDDAEPHVRGGASESALIHQLPAHRDLLARLRFPVLLVRAMTLGPGGVIVRHQDPFLGPYEGLLRLHVPVVTNPLVEFFIDGAKCEWSAGYLWYGDFARSHYGVNKGGEPRIHIVIDAPVTNELAAEFNEEFRQELEAIARTLKPRLGLLQRYCFDFSVPRGFVVPGFPPTATELPGRVSVAGGALQVAINGQPMLRLRQNPDGTFEVLGLPMAARLRYFVSDGSLSHVDLESSESFLHRFYPLRVVQ